MEEIEEDKNMENNSNYMSNENNNNNSNIYNNNSKGKINGNIIKQKITINIPNINTKKDKNNKEEKQTNTLL